MDMIPLCSNCLHNLHNPFSHISTVKPVGILGIFSSHHRNSALRFCGLHIDVWQLSQTV